MPHRPARRALRAAACACLLPAAALPADAGAQAGAATPATSAEGPQPAGQPDRVTGRRTYEAAYFAPYSPATALQIVSRVPGFSIERVDSSVRGFGQAAGNVVVNGQRPSSKSDTLETILSRIPASRVLRVEVGTGDLFGAEFVGKPQVLNLVTTTTGGIATTLEGSVRRAYTGQWLPEGSVSTQLKRGNSTFGLALTVVNQVTPDEGDDRVTTVPGGVETEYRRKRNDRRDPNAALAATWEYIGGAQRTAHLNARIAVDRLRLEQDNRVTRAGEAGRDDALSERYDLDEYELGGDVTRPLAGGGVKLIGLATRRTRDNRDLSLIDLSAPTGFAQALNDRLAETLARVVWNRADLHGWSVELGGEGVVNQLTSRVDLFALAAGGGRTRIDLPVDDATVREVRGEAFVNVGRALSPALRIDTGLTVEASRLTVGGDVAARRTLRFLKPKVSLDWRPSPRWHLQLSVQRTVAQLQFEDFISSAELSNDRVNGGNANLVPQRSWDLRAVAEHQILGDGLVRVEAGYSHVSLVQDRVPTPEGFDAPGNLGDGRILILKSTVEAPLTRLGVKGGRLTLYGSLVPTRVRDPYTGRQRPFTDNSLFFGSATFRQDLGSFAWGTMIEVVTTATGYRLDELDRERQDPYVEGFVEWRATPRSIVTFTVENLLDAGARRDRLFFAPDRRTPDASSRELRERSQHVRPMLTVKRTFG